MDELAPGTVFAGFTIEESLGVGGMGTVYLARHPRIPRKVALKLLHRSLTDDDYARTLFEREADHAARLDHPNIVAVLDRGNENGHLWIAMQYVPGMNAATAVRDDPLDPAHAVHIIEEIAEALDYAHAEGVLHRDVKPANILLERSRSARRGRVLLADFGIAKALTETNQHTKTGMLVASLQYAAPEQFEAAQLDRRADVYSLGCTLFHLLTGRPPYPGTSLPKLMNAHLHGSIPAPSHFGVGVPASFDAVFERALAKQRNDRYGSAPELAAAAVAALTSPAQPHTSAPIFTPAPTVAPSRPQATVAPSPPPTTHTLVGGPPQPEPTTATMHRPVPTSGRPAAHSPAPEHRQRHEAPAQPPTSVAQPPTSAGPPPPATGQPSAGKPEPDRRKWIAAAAVAVLAVIAAGGIWWSSNRPVEDPPPPDPTTAEVSAAPSTAITGADGNTYTIAGDIYGKYSSLTAAQLVDLGLPLADEKTNPDGIYQWFVGGVIIQQSGREAHVVWGEIRNKWNELGGSQGDLGYPTSDELDIAGAKVSTFERGTITFENGEVTVNLNGQ